MVTSPQWRTLISTSEAEVPLCSPQPPTLSRTPLSSLICRFSGQNMSNAQLPPHPRFRRRVAASSASVRRGRRKQRTSSQYDKKKRKGKKRRVERKAEKWRRTHIILAFYRDVSLAIPSSSLTFSFAEFLGISGAHAF